MVVGLLSTIIFLQIITNYGSTAISCFDLQLSKTGSIIRKGTCEGDLCVYFHPGTSVDFHEEKSCLSGFQLPLGCIYNSADNSVMCICNSENCNDGKVEGGTRLPEYMCKADSELNGTRKGSICTASGALQIGTYYTETLVSTTDPLPLPREDPDLGKFYFYPGIVHSYMIAQGWRMHEYRCVGDSCNDITITALPILKKVSCYDEEVHDPENATCLGEFCVFAVDHVRKASQRFCMSTLKLQAAESYKAGLYKYKTTTYYLCQEDGCNYDEATANGTIIYPGPEEPPMPVAAKVLSVPVAYILLSIFVLFAIGCMTVAVVVVVKKRKAAKRAAVEKENTKTDATKEKSVYMW